MSYVRTSGNITEQVTFEHQADAILNQANPVSGTQYTVLNTVKNARIISISAIVTWTVQPTPLEIWVTIDGQTLRMYFNDPASATAYEAGISAPELADQILSAWANYTPNRAFLLEGKSIRVQAETTGGTVQNLSVRVKYATRKG